MSTLGDLTVPKIDQSGPPKTGEFTYIDISSIDNDLKRIVEPKFLPGSAAPSRAKQRLQPGDVLVSMTRPNLNAVAIVSHDLTGAIGSTGFHVLRPVEGIEPRWLFYGVQTHAFIDAMSSLVQGALYPAVRPKDIKGFGLDAPSWFEQQRIVAEIEKQFSRLDEAVANLKRVKANLKRYKAAVLKAAVEGKLTEDWRRLHPNVEPASKLLERILAERRAKWTGRGKYKEIPVPDRTNLPPLPNTWTWSSVETICSDVVDCPHSTPKWEATGRVCLRTTEFRPGRLVLADVRFVSQSTYEKRIQRLKPRENDVVYSREGGILGVACMVPHGIDLCLGQRMMLLRSHSLFTPNLLMHWLNSSWILARVRSLTGGSASPHLNVGEVKLFPVPIPPLNEQQQIVAEVDRRLSVIDELEAAVQANLTRADRLRQSILGQAFAGRLQC
ncbi:MAG: restriction endonuclease subunit S [Nitrospira sp.]|jgi:type I restriction enzyme S subunit|nr:restriction endonuclease subunit S [Nitrospira sp.]